MAEPSDAPKDESKAVTPTAGVYYRREDSPGVLSRAIIALIDAGAVLGIAVGAIAAFRSLMPPGHPLFALSVLTPVWIYLVPLKYSGLGTLGYLVFGVEVVNLTDERPGLVRLTLRTLLALWFNPIVDFGFASSETSRQCLRDKLTGTYVIKKSATSAGRGEFVYATTFFLSAALVYREVKRKD